MKALRQGLVIKLILLVVTSDMAAAAAGNSFLRTTWEPLCELAAKIAGYSSVEESKLTEANNAREKIIADQLRLAIFAASGNTERAKNFAPFQAYVRKRRAPSAADFNKAIGKALAATHKLAFLQGNIAEFMTLTATAHGSSTTNGCLEDAKGTSVIKGTGQLPQCGLKAVEPTPENTGANGLKAATMYAGLTGTSGASATATGTTINCALSKHATNTILVAQTLDEDLLMAGGYLYTDKSVGDTKVKQKPAITSPGKATGPAAYKEAYEAAYASENVQLSRSAERRDPAQAPDDQDAQKAHKLYVEGDTSDFKESDDAAAAKTSLSSLYKSTTADQNSKTWKLIDEMPIPKAIFTTEKNGNQNLGSITDINDLLTILEHYSITNRVAAAETIETMRKAAEAASRKTKSAEEKQKECTAAGDDEGECDKLEKQGCVFNKDGKNGEKCTLSEEGKQKAAEQAAQETEGKDGKHDQQTHHTTEI
ncbi:Variant Surface Glycoprotein, putative [Trypanosoma equiperdum]|uniref:Variant Surface Glycoprotein, putative n=1 Tax=Trypanosoma equiperdum TaxID=5694 RepID=A0A1G4I862_TRYEQ|nr:Variant Surface Glycoprotein, putative [Trypanosoma equiperdum]